MICSVERIKALRFSNLNYFRKGIGTHCITVRIDYYDQLVEISEWIYLAKFVFSH